MRKWIIIGIGVLIIVVIGVISTTLTHVTDAGSKVDTVLIQAGIEQTPLRSVTGSDQYFGTENLLILYGVDDDDQEMVVWLDEVGQLLKYEWLEQGVTQDEIAHLVESKYEVGRKIKIIPGRENEQYLWEATYATTDGGFQYVYYDFYSGAFLQSIKLKGSE